MSRDEGKHSSCEKQGTRMRKEWRKIICLNEDGKAAEMNIKGEREGRS